MPLSVMIVLPFGAIANGYKANVPFASKIATTAPVDGADGSVNVNDPLLVSHK